MSDEIITSWKFALYFIVFMIVSQVTAQCPTISNANQAFCDADNPRIIDLVATDTGDGVVWYDQLVGGNILTDNILLLDGETYYADNDSADCAARSSVTVSISGEPPTNVDVAVSRCSADINTISQLNASGTNLEWYSDRNDGTLLNVNTLLENGVTYWVQQTEGSCVSIRLPTTVTIIDPGAPTGAPEQFFCFDPNNPVTIVVANLSASGDDINWYNSPTSTSPLDSSTPLINNATYYATQTTFPCESTHRFSTIARIDNLQDPGINGTLTICDSATSAMNLFDQLGGTPDTTGEWSGPFATTNAHLGTLDTSLLDTGSYTFTYTIAAVNACPVVSSTVTIDVQDEPNAGEDGLLDICTNEPTVDLFGLLGGEPDAGGTWSPALTSGTGVFDPFVDTSGNYTYTVSPTAPCTSNDSATVTVTVFQAPFAGIDTAISLCSNDPELDLFTLLPGADSGGTWSPALASGTNIFNPSVDTSGNYTYTVQANAQCEKDEAIISVTVSPQPFAGEDNAIELCSNNEPVDLFSLLNGSPTTGGTWSPAMASGTGLYDPAVDPGTTYTYTVDALGTCSGDTAEITVTLNVLPNPGIDATITVCGDDSAFDLFSLLTGTPDAGGTWSGPSTLTNGDQGTFDPATNNSGDYTYSLTGAGACENVSSIVRVTVVNPTPTLPTDGQIFCIADSPTVADLIARVLPEMSGTINVYPTDSSTTAIDGATQLINGSSYFISETDIVTSCEGTNRLTVTIQINNPDIPQLSNTAAEFCLIDNPTIADLNAFIAVGTNVVWVDAETNGNQFSDTDTLVSGDYYAIEDDINSCRSEASVAITITINDNPAPLLNANGNELCGVNMPTIADLEANVTAEEGLTVIWYDANEGGNVLNTSDILTDNGTYYAATTNAITGCESNLRLEITVDLTACDLEEHALMLPDGFSPNGDGINDTYNLRDVEFLYENYTIEIYNRYGNLIFMGNNSLPPWDGTSNQAGASRNKIVPNGVYFYIFHFNRNNKPPKQGRVYLNR